MPVQWVYPQEGHVAHEATTFVYGLAPADVAVSVGGCEILNRSVSGYFAQKVPLSIGDQELTLAVGELTESRQVIRYPKPELDCRTNVFGALHVSTSFQASPQAVEWFSKPNIMQTPDASCDLILRSAPTACASSLTPLLPRALVQVVGQVQQQDHTYWAIDLGKGCLGWYCGDLVAADAVGLPQPIRVLETRAVSDSISEVAFPLKYNPVLQVVKATQKQLVVQLSQCQHWADVIRFDPNDTVIHNLTCQSDGRDTVTIDLAVSQLAGVGFWQADTADEYGVRDRGVWVQTLPKDIADWCIVLDAGHGGSEMGTIAPNGVAEKDLNLNLAVAAKAALEASGFGTVLLSRGADVELPLAERVAWIEAQQPHIVLSLHHNALPDGRDPLSHQGLSTYYYHGFSRGLAQQLLADLSQSLNTPTYGLFEDSLALPRIHTALSVLIEYGFTTHPDDAERILAPDYPERAAQGLCDSLLAYAKQQNR